MRKTILVLSMILTAAIVCTAQTFKIDSVTVDSVWNSDTNAYQTDRIRRDVKVSFVPVASDSVTCFVDMSMDSGKSWTCNRDSISDIGDKASFRCAPNRKSTVIMRLQMGDTTGVVFRVTGRKDTASAGRFWIASEISGVAQDTSQNFYHYYFHNATTLADPINGHYTGFSRNGFIDGIMQKLISADSSKSYTTAVYDFGLPPRASRMLDDRRAAWYRKTTIPTYDSTIVLAKMDMNGYTVGAHFGHFYMEFSVNGYNVNSADSVAAKLDATRFLDFYKAKASQP